MFRIGIILLMLTLGFTLFAQNASFVDGYHGGIYGHYPLEWETRFITDTYYNHPEWRICLEIEPETWDSVELRTVQDYNRFKKIVANERVEFTNPTYAQPYCFNISGESIIRQFEYGIKKINSHFPDVRFTTYSVEEPCFTSCLPQILKSFGFRYAVLKCPNTCWGGYTRAHGKELVNWIGPDGTSILSVPRYECEHFEKNSTWQTKAWNNSTSYLKDCSDSGIKNPVGMCFQDAGWKNGPWLGFGINIRNNSTYVTWKEYIEKISVGETNDNWHFSQEDVLVNLMWGSQVLQKIAQQVRKSENNILAAEKTGSMAYLENKYRYSKDRMDEAWRTLMLAQHHDSWIVPYNRLKTGRTWAGEIARWTDSTDHIAGKVISEAVASFEGEKKSTDEDCFIKMFNTLGFQRNEIVRLQVPKVFYDTNFVIQDIRKKEIPYSLEKGNIICFQAEVPPFGYATYRIVRGKPASKTKATNFLPGRNECVLENEFYKMVFDLQKGGTIKSLIVKNNGRKEYVKKDSEYLLGEIRGYFYDEKRFHSSKEKRARLTLISDNQFETSVLIEGEIALHPFRQIVSMGKGQERIDFDLEIDWKHNVGIGEYKEQTNWQENRRAFCDDRFKLNVLFPVDFNSTKLTKNAPFDVCESRLENTFFNSWDSLKNNVILNWVDLTDTDNGNSMALFTDHTTSYSYGKDFPLGLTIQYSGKGLWGRDYTVTEPLHVKYALLPHKNSWDRSSVSEESECWNEHLITCQSDHFNFENKSFINVQNSGYELSSVQTMTDGVLVRFYNAKGKEGIQKIKLGFPFKSIREIELNGNTKQPEVQVKVNSTNELLISIPKFGLRTFCIKN
jgi:alpha-mannosidase